MKLKELLSKKLYHATYKPNLDSILKKGLNNKVSKKNWNDSKNYVYLSTSPDVAESYAETSDDVPEDYLDKIVVLEIDGNKIDKKLLGIDSNNLNKDTIQYKGIISPSAIKVYRG